jgi:hypothetical protein
LANNESYTNKIQPKLATITVLAIASAMDVSMPYAVPIRVADAARIPGTGRRLQN